MVKNVTAAMQSLIGKHVNSFSQIPGVVIIHETITRTVVYMNGKASNNSDYHWKRFVR